MPQGEKFINPQGQLRINLQLLGHIANDRLAHGHAIFIDKSYFATMGHLSQQAAEQGSLASAIGANYNCGAAWGDSGIDVLQDLLAIDAHTKAYKIYAAAMAATGQDAPRVFSGFRSFFAGSNRGAHPPVRLCRC